MRAFPQPLRMIWCSYETNPPLDGFPFGFLEFQHFSGLVLVNFGAGRRRHMSSYTSWYISGAGGAGSDGSGKGLKSRGLGVDARAVSFFH